MVITLAPGVGAVSRRRHSTGADCVEIVEMQSYQYESPINNQRPTTPTTDESTVS